MQRKPIPMSRRVPLDISDFLMRKHNIVMPFQALWCQPCRQHGEDLFNQHKIDEKTGASDEIPDRIKKLYETPQSSESLFSDSQPVGSQVSVGSGGWQPEPSAPPELDESGSTEFKVNGRQLIFDLIKNCNENFKWKQMAYRTQRPYPKLSRNAHYRMKRSLSFGVSSMIQTLCSFKEDYIEIWKDLKKSMMVDKALGAKGNSDILLEEVIKSYNLSSTPEGKIMALSLVANNFTFKQLCKFNPPDKGIKGLKKSAKKHSKQNVDETGENVDDIQALLDSDDDSDDSNKDSDISTDEELSASQSDQCLYWKPELKFYFYQRARLHYRLSNGAVQPLIVPRKNNWKISFEVLRTIIDFVTSDEIQQSVAFGTCIARGSDGNRVKIAKAIRR